MAAIVRTLLHCIAIGYLLPINFFVPYYNWQYAKTHSLADWLFLGELTATVKALLWPYHLLYPSNDTALKEAWSHYVAAEQFHLEAMRLEGQGNWLKSETEQSEIESVYRKALSESEQVDVELLNTLYSGLGDHFEDEFVEGLKYRAGITRSSSPLEFLRLEALLVNYMTWIDAHIVELRHAVEHPAE